MKDDDTYFQTTRPASPSNSVNKAKGWNGWQYWKNKKWMKESNAILVTC